MIFRCLFPIFWIEFMLEKFCVVKKIFLTLHTCSLMQPHVGRTGPSAYCVLEFRARNFHCIRPGTEWAKPSRKFGIVRVKCLFFNKLLSMLLLYFV